MAYLSSVLQVFEDPRAQKSEQNHFRDFSDPGKDQKFPERHLAGAGDETRHIKKRIGNKRQQDDWQMFVFRDPLLEFLIPFFITKPDLSAYPSHIARELAQSRARKAG